MADTNITISDEELHRGELTPETLRLATLLLHTRGYVILKNAIPAPLVEELHRSYAAIYQDCLQSWQGGEEFQTSHREGASFFVRNSRWRIFPRLQPPFNHPHISANGFLVPILAAILGADFYCKFVSSDTCARGAILQAPHRDLIDTDRSRGPAAYMVNVPLVECGLHNGPLEVWPCGSHLWRDDVFYWQGIEMFVQDGRNPVLERFAERLPSEKVLLRPGEILIRDPAMLHRGTPNPCDKARMMLTICYLRRDASIEYASPYYNLDRGLFEQLDARVAKLFAYAFRPSSGNGAGVETLAGSPSLKGRLKTRLRWLARSYKRLQPRRTNRAA